VEIKAPAVSGLRGAGSTAPLMADLKAPSLPARKDVSVAQPSAAAGRLSIAAIDGI